MDCIGYSGLQTVQRCAIRPQDLAPKQIKGLDSGRSLMDRVQTIVSPHLLNIKISRVAVTTMDLDRQIIGDQTELRWPAFRDRGQQPKKTSGLIVRLSLKVRTIETNSERYLGIAFLLQQHPANVRMVDNRNRSGRGLAEPAPLFALLSVSDRVPVSAIPQCSGTNTNADPRLIHHHEHLRQPLALTANAPANGTVLLTEIQKAVCCAPVTHLVIQTGDGDIIPGPIRQNLGHDEQ